MPDNPHRRCFAMLSLLLFYSRRMEGSELARIPSPQHNVFRRRRATSRPLHGVPRWRGSLLLVACLVAFPSWISAETDDRSVSDRTLSDAKPPVQGAAPPPSIGLDRLLKLPKSFEDQGDRRGGANEDMWRTRFETAREKLADSKRALAKAKAELSDTAGEGGGWNVSAPGGKGEISPLSYKLRQEIRRETENSERYGRELRDLEIEANLSSVPKGWRT